MQAAFPWTIFVTSKRALPRQLSVTFLVGSFLFCIANQADANTVRFRCMWRDNPATTMVIGWDQVTGSNPIFYYDVVDNGQKTDLYKMSKKPDVVLPARGMNNHFVRLNGLKPNTIYYFVIRDNENVSRRFSFKTAPDKPERISLISGGDSRNFRDARRSANKLVSKLRPHAVLFNGDMTPDDTAGEWKKWLDDWQETIGSDGRIFPVIVARGNHEASNQSLIELFDVPNPNIYYALNMGGNLLHITTLNTMIPANGEQLTWLEKDLQQSNNITWRLIQYHNAMRPHTKTKPEQDNLVANWAPLFLKYKVQLAIESDSHVAKWTYPIRPSNEPGSDEGFIRDDEKGTVYVGEGCWGAPLRDADDDKTWTRNSGSFNQFNWIFVDANKVEVRVVLTDVSANVGQVKDQNIFEPPVGLSLWSPSNGDVVTIYKNPPPVAVVSKPKRETPPIATASVSSVPEKPVTTSTSKPARTTAGAAAITEESVNIKLKCDASGKVSFKYSLARAGDVVILLLDNDLKVINRQALPGQVIKSYLKELDLSSHKNGNYTIVVKCGGDLVQKYQVSK